MSIFVKFRKIDRSVGIKKKKCRQMLRFCNWYVVHPQTGSVVQKFKNEPSIFQFRYTEPFDYLLLTIGTLVAVVTGGGWPFMSTIFGGLSQTFIKAQAAIDIPNSTFYDTPR